MMEDREMEYRCALDKIVYKRGLKLSRSEKTWFNKLNPGFYATGEVIELWEAGYLIVSKPVFKGQYTPSMAIRDCGSYYIEAKYSRYIKIDKDTLKIIDYDCEDY